MDYFDHWKIDSCGSDFRSKIRRSIIRGFSEEKLRSYTWKELEELEDKVIDKLFDNVVEQING